MVPHQENGTVWRLAARCTEMSRAKRVQEGDLFMLLLTFMFHLLCPTRIETTGSNIHILAPPLTLTQMKDTAKMNPSIFWGDSVDQMLVVGVLLGVTAP